MHGRQKRCRPDKLVRRFPDATIFAVECHAAAQAGALLGIAIQEVLTGCRGATEHLVMHFEQHVVRSRRLLLLYCNDRGWPLRRRCAAQLHRTMRLLTSSEHGRCAEGWLAILVLALSHSAYCALIPIHADIPREPCLVGHCAVCRDIPLLRDLGKDSEKAAHCTAE